jgi:RimJ/RimL family protein N-acetyltransferase
MIETPRLILSAWTEAERTPYGAMCADPEVMHDYPAPFDEATACERFDRHMAAFPRDGFGKWTLRRKDDGAYLGYCGVSPIWPTLAVAPGLEIGWRMVRAAWGHGYATEAARAALVDIFARTDATEVVTFTNTINRRSQAVMRRLGLDRDASRDFNYEDGKPAVVFVAPRARHAASTEGTT